MNIIIWKPSYNYIAIAYLLVQDFLVILKRTLKNYLKSFEELFPLYHIHSDQIFNHTLVCESLRKRLKQKYIWLDSGHRKYDVWNVIMICLLLLYVLI